MINEVWVNSPQGEASSLSKKLHERPFDALRTLSHRELEARLREDPIARGSIAMLIATAAIALILATFGLLLGGLSEIRDERRELFDLEAQGLGPAKLRRQIHLRMMITAAFGLLFAAAAAAALSALVVRFVLLTASATEPEPPLRLWVSWSGLGLALAPAVLLVTTLVLLTTARAFRSRTAVGTRRAQT
jgi:hypothetical protein